MKGEFRVRAIYQTTEEQKATPKKTSPPPAKTAADETGAPPEAFRHIIDYIDKILVNLGAKNYTINVKTAGDNNIIDITGENLGIIIGRRGETLDSLQYLSILANNRSGAENARLRLVVDCNGYREKRTETLETLAIRTSNKVIKQGRRITLEPMNPYERRIIHSKVAGIDGVFSNSIGEEPYRKVVISAEIAKRRHSLNKDDRKINKGTSGGRSAPYTDTRPANAGPILSGREYKQSNNYSTSFEREYKRTLSDAPEISQDTVDVEKNTSLYGKIEL
jgi:spoIIIJ-associated protein